MLTASAFTQVGLNFQTADISAGMILTIYTASPSEGKPYEITAVDANSLTLSILRPNLEDAIVAPPAAESVSFFIRTFRPQIRQASASLAEKLRQVTETAEISASDFADSQQLRLCVAHAALAAIFTARAENAQPNDPNWIKADYYRQESRRLQLQLRLAADADGNHSADSTRTLGNVTLRRI